MAGPVELGVAAVLTLVVLWAVNRAQSFVTALVDGRADLLTWDDRMAELSGERADGTAGRGGGAAEQEEGTGGRSEGEGDQ